MTETPHVPHVHVSGGASPFTRKLGPFPVYVYAAAIIALGLGYAWYRSRSASTPAVDTTGAASDASDLAAPSLSESGSDESDGGAVTTPVASSAGDVALPTTNAAWAIYVETRLIAAGHDPGTVTRALSNYLNGNTPTAAQYAIIEDALKIMPPPVGVIVAKTPPAAAKPPVKVTTPTKGKTAPVSVGYTIRKGDTWNTIAQMHYGSTEHAAALKAGNSHAVNPKGIGEPIVGAHIVLPGFL